MKTQKMSLAKIQGKLSRIEMKNIMAGSGPACVVCYADSECDSNHVCRSSPSCFQSKVCALPYYC